MLCFGNFQRRRDFGYHLLRHILRDIFVEVKRKLNGFIVLVFPFELLNILNAQPQFDSHHFPVVLFGELHTQTGLLLEEGVVQQILDGIS